MARKVLKKGTNIQTKYIPLSKSLSICTTLLPIYENSANMSVLSNSIIDSLFKSKVLFANFSMLTPLVSINQFVID